MLVRANLAASVASAGLALALAAPAHAAADAPAAEAASTATATAADAATQPVDDSIVVTARRRAETVQTVPLAVTVVGGAHIENTGAFNVGRLTQLTPTLQFYSSNPRNTSVNIRGLGAPLGLTNDGIEQGVGIYIDDVFYARAASSTFDFLDVSRIEVLRGPQGTLFGKNTTAGALNITTRAPTFDPEARLEASAGNLGFVQLKGAVSGPLSDTLAVRLAGSFTQRDGTVYNVAQRQWINSQDNKGARLQFLWRPTGGVEVTLSGDYNKQNPNCCALIYVRTGATQRPLTRQYAALAAAQNYAVPSTNPFDRVTDEDVLLRAKNEVGGVSLRAKIDTGIGTVTSITAWRYWDWDPSNDRDYLGLPITTKSNNPSHQDQYTQELRLTGETGRFNYTVGAFGFYQKIHTSGVQQQGPAASKFLINPTSTALYNDPSVLNGLTATNDITLKNTSAAIYGKFGYKLSDTFSIQPGVRLNYDKKDGVYSSVVTDGNGNLVVFETNADGTSANSSRERAQLAVLAPQYFKANFSNWNVSGDVTLAWDPTRDVHVYGTYARSFKSGGINLNGVPANTDGTPLLQFATIKPERVNHFELGVKTQFWGRKGTFNVAAFRTDINDYQAQVSNYTVGALRGYLANAEKVRTQGVEVDFALRPSERFSVYSNAAYTDAKYVRFKNAPCPPELSGGTQTVDANGNLVGTPAPAGTPGISPLSCDISGQVLPGVSKWSFSYGGEVNLPVQAFGGEGQVYLGVDGNYRSRFSSNPTPSAYTWVEGYALTNFRLGVRRDARFDIYGWVRNAFDTHYFDQLAVASGNTGLIVGQVGDPRTYGLTVRTQF
ncbi:MULTISPECIES: TonB-dependent receptor [unclassified Sphingomonas]|uniref:TonB-dependent receptor n=1 Tax=Novosphingobium rhizosphaerae TaxID=1551649 RepID=UPI0015C949B7